MNQQEAGRHDNGRRGRALVNMVLLLIFIGAAVYFVKFSPARQYLTPDQLGIVLDAAGLWAPVIFVIIYVLGVCLFLPGTLLTALGAAIFGDLTGGFSTSGQVLCSARVLRFSSVDISAGILPLLSLVIG